ncbi:MAG: ComEC/Rec2 family competence protein [Chloroflexi bacterium]|nr:ComEC/Rec2 family competence protein [Chloroflexota bacterium]MQC26140.1 ComEC/Rec2 family competence protein [Chloroflexota bacterium]
MDTSPLRTALLRLNPLLWMSLAFLSGDAIAFAFALSWIAWLLLAVLSFMVWLRFYRLPRFQSLYNLPLILVLTLAACAFFLGGLRYGSSQRPLGVQDLAFFNDSNSQVEIVGVVTKPPIKRDTYIELRLRVNQLELVSSGQHQNVVGQVLARVSEDKGWRYGDQVLLSGHLETPPEFEDFSYRAYLERQGIASLMPFARAVRLETGKGNPLLAALYALHDQSLSHIYRLYPDPEASLLAGILLGDESGLSDALKQDFNNTGARHVIAISGFNITIIAGLLLSLFRRTWGATRGTWIAVVGISLYTLLVGADAAVVRAAIMGTLTLLARQVGRRQHALNTLSFTAAVMALLNPLILWDVGFQLSFAATLGILLYAEPLNQWAARQLAKRFAQETAARLAGPLGEFVLITIAAQITTLPLLLYHFQRFSFLSLPVNILILPVQPAIMVLGGLSILVAFILFPFGQVLAYAAWPFAAFTIRIVEVFAHPSWSSLALPPYSLVGVVLAYILIAYLTLRPPAIKFNLRNVQPVAVASGLLILNLWLWAFVLASPNGRLQLTLLDVGNGEALLVRTPTGRNVLINGGQSEIRLAEEMGRSLLPNNRSLDWLLVAGVDKDQIAALPASLERLSPGHIAWFGSLNANYDARQLRAVAADSNLQIEIPNQGAVFDLGGDASLRVLSVNEAGTVLLLQMNNFLALLPLGHEPASLQDLDWGELVGQVDVLLLTGGGESELNPTSWLENLDPALVLLSVDAANSKGLPDAEVLNDLQPRTILRTDQNGWIRISTDGKQMWIETAR